MAGVRRLGLVGAWFGVGGVGAAPVALGVWVCWEGAGMCAPGSKDMQGLSGCHNRCGCCQGQHGLQRCVWARVVPVACCHTTGSPLRAYRCCTCGCLQAVAEGPPGCVLGRGPPAGALQGAAWHEAWPAVHGCVGLDF
jgi:hypothetical protein